MISDMFLDSPYIILQYMALQEDTERRKGDEWEKCVIVREKYINMLWMGMLWSTPTCKGPIFYFK